MASTGISTAPTTTTTTATTPDALDILRYTLSTQQTITLLSSSHKEVFDLSSASFLSFPPFPSSSSNSSQRIILPRSAPTRFKKTAAPTSDFYDLGTLLLCFLKKDDIVKEYIQESQKLGLGFVSTLERRNVAEYLAGRGDGGGKVVPLDGARGDEGERVGGEEGEGKKGGERTTEGEAGGERPAKRSRYAVDMEDRDNVKRLMTFHESRQLMDRDTVLRISKGGRINNFDHARALIVDRLRSFREEYRKLSGPTPQAVSRPVPSTSDANPRRRRPHNPIIIVSPSPTALITMDNVKRFLEEGFFERSEVVRERQGGKGEDTVVVSHRRNVGVLAQGKGGQVGGGAAGLGQGTGAGAGAGGSQTLKTGEKTVIYNVVNSTDELTKRYGSDAWDRVVCVMTTGQDWQFADYKWPDPKELFHNVKGIYFQWSNEGPNLKVRSWNVTELKIDSSKRHVDKSTVADFWRVVEAWIATHKPYLDY